MMISSSLSELIFTWLSGSKKNLRFLTKFNGQGNQFLADKFVDCEMSNHSDTRDEPFSRPIRIRRNKIDYSSFGNYTNHTIIFPDDRSLACTRRSLFAEHQWSHIEFVLTTIAIAILLIPLSTRLRFRFRVTSTKPPFPSSACDPTPYRFPSQSTYNSMITDGGNILISCDKVYR